MQQTDEPRFDKLFKNVDGLPRMDVKLLSVLKLKRNTHADTLLTKRCCQPSTPGIELDTEPTAVRQTDDTAQRAEARSEVA